MTVTSIINAFISGIRLFISILNQRKKLVIDLRTKNDHIVIRITNMGEKPVLVNVSSLLIKGNNKKNNYVALFGAELDISNPFLPHQTAEVYIGIEDFEDILDIEFRKRNKTWFTCIVKVELSDVQNKKYRSPNVLYCSEVGDFFEYNWKRELQSWKNEAKPIKR